MSRLSPDEVILGLLQAAPAHGYELLERFRDPAHLGRIWNMSTSQIYAVLKRLESEGAIVGQPIPQPDAPARTEYHITTQGKDSLAAWLADSHPPISIHRIRVVFLSRLYIATLLGQPTDVIIERQLSVCVAQLEKNPGKPAHLPFPGGKTDFGICGGTTGFGNPMAEALP